MTSAGSGIDFFFEFASTYSYVAAMRIEEECARARVPVRFRPFLLGPIFTEQLGIQDSPFNVQPARGRYMWRDLERLCNKHGLEWRKPSAFPRRSILAARAACALHGDARQGDCIRALFRANFAEDRDIADPAVVADALRGCGVDAEAVLARASSPEVKAALRANTERARASGIFGAPNCLVGSELFFGQDRIDDAIAWATSSPAGK
ncbi:MAG: 2-hydroxychromene-2-carboxylate isomerase [Myxococcales bacterium]